MVVHHDVLAQYLTKHGREVFNMLFVEYDAEKDKAVYGKECCEEGLKQGS
ncbi:MAG: hypothetical protein IJ192_08960 [Clostridia bacterium]|nr:hypothetical protein [Clostridia bacterium]